MCNKCSKIKKCDDCITKSIITSLKSLASPISGKVIGNEILLFRENIPIGKIPFVYSETQFKNAFGNPLV